MPAAAFCSTTNRRAAASNLSRAKSLPAWRAFWPGKSAQIALGNLEAQRDWGHAREYVEAMWLMLQQPEPDDYVVATGETHSVREFVEMAFSHVGLDYRDYVATDPTLFRPAEVNLLLGDCTKARTKLGWQSSIAFGALVREMVEADCRTLGVARDVSGHQVVQHA